MGRERITCVIDVFALGKNSEVPNHVKGELKTL
jgi:hypothetical protein